MISLYTGTPGSGKSLHLAREIRDIVKYKNKWVISNIPINMDKIKGRHRGKFIYLSEIDLTPERLIQISFEFFGNKPPKEGQLLIVVDECQLMFNAREWNCKGRSDWLKFFTLHRHLGYDIILVCQFDTMIDKQIRCLVEYQFVHRKLKNMGWRGYILMLCSLGRKFAVIKYWYPMREKLGTSLLYADRRLFKIYDTYMLFSSQYEEFERNKIVNVSCSDDGSTTEQEHYSA